MLKEPITVLVRSTVGGPGGVKMKPGQVAVLEDSPYVRVLIKSGSVSLVDPPSLDPAYLEKAGYELRDGFTYPLGTDISVKKEQVKKDIPVIKRPISRKVSEETIVSNGKEDSQEDGIKE